MGYGIKVTGTASRAGLFGFGVRHSTTLKLIHEAFDATVTEPIPRRFLLCQKTEDALFVRLHPTTEHVEISINGSQILVSAKTSTAGPGYHAHLIDVLDNVSELAGIKFDCTKNDESGDETGYHEHRSIELLRDESVLWLRTICDHILDSSKVDGLVQVNMPTGFDRVASDYFAMTPMGEFPREWFEQISHSNRDTVEDMAERFFPAWRGPERAEYWANIARYLMLWHVEWTVAANERQRQCYEDAIACMEYARHLDPALEVPDAELEELKRLLEGGETSAPPKPDGFGFRRGLMERQLGDDWHGRIPGYFNLDEQTHKDGNSHRYYWFGEREIHFSVLTFSADDDEITPERIIRKIAVGEDGSETFEFTKAAEWMDTVAVSSQLEENIIVQAGFGISRDNEHEVLMLTIFHESDEGGARWARELLESVSCPAPDAN